MDRLHIVQIVESLEIGGLERMAIDLATAHRNAGHASSIYTVFEPGALASQAEAAGIPVTAFRRGPGPPIKLLAAMAARLLRDEAQVVHTHNLGIHVYGAVAARLAGVPAVLNTRHGPANSQGKPYHEPYFRIAMPFTDAVVFVSEDCGRVLGNYGHIPPSKSHVIVNGIDTAPFLAHPASPNSASPGIRFGAVGRLLPVKGHSILLQAFAQVLRRLPEAELRIVGGGPLFEELSQQASALGILDNVSLEGSHPRVYEVFPELDVLVFPSLSEGLPLVVLEAMAAGLPLVSSRVGGVPEVAPEGEVAWFCAPGSAQELAEAMFCAAVSPRLREMGARARQLAVARYDLKGMQGKYELLYRRILSRS